MPEARHSATRPHKPLTVIGLGNEYLSDDGAGIGVLREVRRRLGEGAAVFEELSIGGLPLLDYIVGFDRCVIIDAVVSGEHPPGTLYRFVRTPEGAPVNSTRVPNALHSYSSGNSILRRNSAKIERSEDTMDNPE